MMTDEPQPQENDHPNNGPQLHPDNLVEQAVERAGEKLAQAAGPIATGGAVLNRLESMAVVAIIIILQLATLMFVYQAKSSSTGNRERLKSLCEVTTLFAPPNMPGVAEKLAKCLR